MPATRIACPSCKKMLKVGHAHAGKRVACPSCKATVPVPGLDDLTLSDANPTITTAVDVDLVAAGLPPAPVLPLPPMFAAPSIKLSCPHCRSALEVAATSAGQTAQCPYCSLLLQVPIPQAQQLPQPTQTQPPPIPADAPKRNSLDFEPLIQTDYAPSEPESRRRNRGNGIVAMVLGLIGFFFIFVIGPTMSMFARALGEIVCVGFVPLLGAILSFVAVMIGGQAMREDSRDGCAKTGYIVGWISLGVVLLEIVAVVALLSAIEMGRSRL